MTANLPKQQEDTLIRRVARGDLEAFEALFRHYQPRIARFAGRLTRRSDIIEETVNDTMVVVWQKAGQFRGQSRLSTWILGIAYRTALKRLRQSSRRAERELQHGPSPIDPEEPETRLSRRQSHEQIRRALLQLSPQHRAVIELTFFEGLSYREIAAIVGCPQNTVKTRMFHARRRLRQILRPHGAIPTPSRRLSDVT